MESVETQYIKRMCNFYVSDIHLFVMLIPYISREIDGDVEVTTIFENNNKHEFKKVIDKLNIKNKNKIFAINWIDEIKKNENESFSVIEETIDKVLNNKRKNTIIINGNRNFISNINNMIDKKDKKNIEELKIIDCYNVEETKDEIKDIVQNYDDVLNTLSCTEIVHVKF